MWVCLMWLVFYEDLFVVGLGYYKKINMFMLVVVDVV